MASVVQKRLQFVLGEHAASSNVRAYFSEPGPGVPTFTGRLFERFGGGGDRDDVADSFTASDVVAVGALNVKVPPDAAYAIVEGSLAFKMTQLLREIPTAIDLGSLDARAHVESNSAAHETWDLLAEQTGIGWVTAGKLMARKRPRLLPIYDQVVRCVLGEPKGAWITLHDALAAPAVHDAVDSLRPAAPAHVSAIRIVDVAIWMRHHNEHARGECLEFGKA